jgi:L-ascorbate metabolism protein UlaG (beta-lactamase superfamily)
MKIRYLGHSCFEIITGGKTLLVDPYISDNSLASDIDVNALHPDFLLITHGHGDHVQDAGKVAKRNKAMVISNFEIVTWFGKKGIEGHGMNHGGKKVFDFGTLKYVNAIHSSTLPDDSPGGNPGGFVLWNDEACLYIAGDTALTQDMRLIPMTCPKLTAAILPIGDNFTMGYEEAVIAAGFIQCDRIIACHFDTFEPIRIDHDAAKKAFRDEHKELIIMKIGASLTVQR